MYPITKTDRETRELSLHISHLSICVNMTSADNRDAKLFNLLRQLESSLDRASDSDAAYIRTYREVAGGRSRSACRRYG